MGSCVKAETASRSIDKFKRIRSLKCYVQVEEMLYAGYPPSAVANFIQSRMNEYRDVKRSSLIEMLKRFRQSMREGGMIHSTLPRVFATAEKKFANKMKELERLEDQYNAQQYRFDVLHAEERMTGNINPQVDKIDKRMESIITRIHSIKMDLGLVGSRDLGTITVSAERVEYIKNKYGAGASDAFKDPVSRGRVLAALGAIKRAGNLRNQDGTPMQLGDHMNLEDDESQIVDVEYEATDADDVPDEFDGDNGADHEEEAPQDPDWSDVREDFSKPDEGMDERVEALDTDDDDDDGKEEDDDLEEAEAPAPPPKEKEVEMEPIRRAPKPNLPPGPRKPSVRGNVKSRLTSNNTRKKK